MCSDYAIDKIRKYWFDQVKKFRQSPSVSWSDTMVIEMEIREIIKWLSDMDNVLDIGCANGYSTVFYATLKRINVRGLDYMPEMIEEARARIRNLPHNLLGKIDFTVGDITNLNEPSEQYDKVVIVRVIINLHDWENQKKGLAECVRVLKSKGTLLLSEATLQGWNRMNALRREWGLPNITMPPFNTYIDEENTIKFLSETCDLIEIVNFTSTYYVATRVLKPLLIKALGSNIDIADPNMEWNRFFAQVPSYGDYGVQKLFVFRKR